VPISRLWVVSRPALALAFAAAAAFPGATLSSGEDFIATQVCIASSAEPGDAPLEGELPASSHPAPAPFTVPTEADMRRYSAIINVASRANGVEGDLVHAIIWAESSYNPNAVSPAGAAGLMQLMPETARSYGVRNIFDPAENIEAGVKIMRQLLAKFDGDPELALAAYNAGAYAVIRAGNRIPPHPETEAYVPKVMDYYRRLQARKA
jgi:soluble lytic murein transglycosylase-like protein